MGVPGEHACRDPIGVYQRAWVDHEDGTLSTTWPLNLAHGQIRPLRLWHTQCVVDGALRKD